MFVMMRALAITFLVGSISCQFINHPFGGLSYVRDTISRGTGFHYASPSSHIHGQFPQAAGSQSTFHGIPGLESQFGFFQPNFGTVQNFGPHAHANVPAPQNLFSPAPKGARAETNKQIQAYNDYLKELIKEGDSF